MSRQRDRAFPSPWQGEGLGERVESTIYRLLPGEPTRISCPGDSPSPNPSLEGGELVSLLLQRREPGSAWLAITRPHGEGPGVVSLRVYPWRVSPLCVG